MNSCSHFFFFKYTYISANENTRTIALAEIKPLAFIESLSDYSYSSTIRHDAKEWKVFRFL